MSESLEYIHSKVLEPLGKGNTNSFQPTGFRQILYSSSFSPVVLSWPCSLESLRNYLAQKLKTFRLQSLNITAMFNTKWGKRRSIGKKIHRSVWKYKNSLLGSLCSQRTGGDWKQKRPPGILGKHSTTRHIIKAEKTFQQRWNFKGLGTRRLAWVILKWSCPLNCKESFLKKGCSVNEAKAGKQGDCPSHLLMSNMLSHESGQFVWFGSLTESPVHLAWWAQHEALGWSKGIAAFCVFNSLSSKQFFF